MRRKVTYLIGNKKVSKKEMITFLGEHVYLDYQRCGIIGISVADYDKAEKAINSMIRNNNSNGTSWVFPKYSVSIKISK